MWLSKLNPLVIRGLVDNLLKIHQLNLKLTLYNKYLVVKSERNTGCRSVYPLTVWQYQVVDNINTDALSRNKYIDNKQGDVNNRLVCT